MHRERLLSVLKAASSDNATKAARKAHKELKLPQPTVEEIAGYRKSVSPDLEMLAAQKYVDSLLDIRTKPLKPGSLKAERRQFQQEVLTALELSVSPTDKKVKKEYEKLALSFSRLFALYYHDERDRQPRQLEGRLETLLPYLAKHLLAEVELCVEAKFTSPFRNLSKISVFDIQKKLEMLEGHSEAVVRENARTIMYAALNNGNIELADGMAAGAKEKLEMLEGHSEAVVRENARTIMCAVLNKGNIELADRMAAGAKEKLEMLEGHSEAVVRENARNIMYAALHKGNIELADRMAAGAKEKLEMLEGHSEAVVRENARTIMCAALNKGNLELADRMAAGAKEKLEMLAKHPNSRVVELRRSVMSQLFNSGNLDAVQVDLNGEIIDL